MKSFRDYLPEDILIPFFGNESIVGVEIGVWHGEGTDKLLNKMPNLKLYSIDPWLYQSGRGYEAEDTTISAEENQRNQDKSYDAVKEMLSKYDARSILVRAKSNNAIKIVNEPIDFVWIDGDHNEDTVRNDIINWKNKLKPKSVLCGHDWRFPHIKNAVYDLLGEPELGDDDIWYFKYVLQD